MLGVPNSPGIAHTLFKALADANIDVDMIVQSIRNIDRDINDIVFTIALDDLPEAKKVIAVVSEKINAITVLFEEDMAKVSIVGAGMLGSPGVAARMFGALAKADVNIDIISTSEISVSCLVKGKSDGTVDATCFKISLTLSPRTENFLRRIIGGFFCA